MSDDREHLRLLSTLHYVMSGITAILGFFPVIYVILGLLMITGALDRAAAGQPRQRIDLPPAFGWMFVIGGVGAMLGAWALSLGFAVGGWHLRRQRRLGLCMVVAGIGCVFTPLGTLLGVFTIIALNKPGVQQLFRQAA